MSELSKSPIGATVTITGHDRRFGIDYKVEAYLPDPLPARVDLSGETWTLVSEAMGEVGRLDAAASLLPNPQLVVRVVTRLEAIGTAALEGTYANLTELFAAEVEPSPDDVPPRVREVLNYLDAVEQGYAWVSAAPITRNLMSQLQATLIRGTESDGPAAGRVRDEQVFIGPKHRPITEARFVPPPPGDQLEAMYDAWFDWIRDDQNPPQLPLIARAALGHYQFEAIHPYHDGNGRVGRLAVALQVIREGALSQPVLSISPWLKDNEDEYKGRLLDVSCTGDWDKWVAFMATAVADEAAGTQQRIARLLALQDELSRSARTAFPRGRLAVDIADSLIGFPIISVAWAEKQFGKTNQASRNAIGRLVDSGILEPYDESRYGRRYWNPSVFRVIAE